MPTVTALNNGNFVVAAEFGGNIFATILSPTGATVSFYQQVNTVTPGVQNDAQVTALTGGGFRGHLDRHEPRRPTDARTHL